MTKKLSNVGFPFVNPTYEGGDRTAVGRILQHSESEILTYLVSNVVNSYPENYRNVEEVNNWLSIVNRIWSGTQEVISRIDELPDVNNAIAQHPKALNAVLEFGPEAVDEFTRMLSLAGDNVDKAGLDILTRQLAQLPANEGIAYLEAMRSTQVENAPGILNPSDIAHLHEAPQALRLGGLVNSGTFEFSINTAEPGIEGFVRLASQPETLRPFSLKKFQDVTTLSSLLQKIGENSNTATELGYTNGIFYAEPIQFTANELKTFAENGPIFQRIVQNEAFNRIILQASDGIVDVTPDNVIIR